MREVFQSQLTEVQSRLVEMAEDTTRIIEKATKAFATSDVALADEAIAICDATSNKALALDELVIKVLARQSPVARDLRILLRERRAGHQSAPWGSACSVSPAHSKSKGVMDESLRARRSAPATTPLPSACPSARCSHRSSAATASAPRAPQRLRGAPGQHCNGCSLATTK